jgi:hypothetical protein
MIAADARSPALARNVHGRFVQVAAQAENLFLRHQLSIALRRAPPRLRLCGSDRALLVWMTRLWPSLLSEAKIVQPETILRCPAFRLRASVRRPASVFITSANLTQAALDRNIELGVLIRDGAICPICSYFRSLIDTGMMVTSIGHLLAKSNGTRPLGRTIAPLAPRRYRKMMGRGPGR